MTVPAFSLYHTSMGTRLDLAGFGASKFSHTPNNVNRHRQVAAAISRSRRTRSQGTYLAQPRQATQDVAAVIVLKDASMISFEPPRGLDLQPAN